MNTMPLQLRFPGSTSNLSGPGQIQFFYSWNCVDCPSRNHKGSVSCESCGHQPGYETPTPSNEDDIDRMDSPWDDNDHEDTDSDDNDNDNGSDNDNGNDDEDVSPVTPSQSRFMPLMSTHTEIPRTTHVLIGGYVRECAMLLSMEMDVPQELIGLLADFCTTLFRWETRDSDVEIYDETKCRRIDLPTGDNLWRNCFGALSVGYPYLHTSQRFRWTLECDGEITIGFIQKEGAERCMLDKFVEYNDGYGVYEDTATIILELQWMQKGGSWKCQFLLNGEKKFELPAYKEYKLAAALNGRSSIACIEYKEYEQ